MNKLFASTAAGMFMRWSPDIMEKRIWLKIRDILILAFCTVWVGLFFLVMAAGMVGGYIHRDEIAQARKEAKTKHEQKR